MHKSTPVVIFLMFCISIFAQCPTGNVILNTQAQVDQFITDYPNCTVISGDLLIEGTVTDISGLSNLIHVQGDLNIHDTALNTINLNSLVHVDGFLQVSYNSQLSSVAFNSVETAINGVNISSNTYLISATGLDLIEELSFLQISNNYYINEIPQFNSLVRVENSLGITENENLISFSGFENLICSGSLTIHGNDELTTPAEFPSLKYLDSSYGLRISYNSELRNYGGFEALERVSFFIIDGNGGGGTSSSMPSFNALKQVGSLNVFSCGIAELNGFHNLEKATEVNLKNLAATTITGFNKLKTVFEIDIADNFHLTSLSGFNNLKIINKLRLFSNSNLNDTNTFLTQIEQIRRDLLIGSNHQLPNLDFLSHLMFVGEFVNSNEITISVNGNLSDCSGISNLFNYGHVPNDIDIANNPFSCGSVSDIQDNGDNDGDGVLDSDDLDDDNDGILDTDEYNGTSIIDTDADLRPDHIDLDSDNDGCYDAIEAGFLDNDSNGTLGSLPDDVDANGIVINETTGYTTPLDSNANTILDFQEMANSPLVSTMPQDEDANIGDNVTFSTIINNADTFQWYISIDNGLNWAALADNLNYSGVNTASLNISDVSITQHSNLYRLDYYNSMSTCQFVLTTNQVVLNVINDLPDAGTNNSITICEDDVAFNLFDLIIGNPDSNGTWSPSLQSGTNMFNPQLDNSGNYTYKVTNGGCEIDTSTISVTIEVLPDTGMDNTLQLCTNSDTTSLFNQLLGTPDSGGSWSPQLNGGSDVFDVNVDNPGTYTYTITNNCGTNTSEIIVTVSNDIPDAGDDNVITVCETQSAFNLFTALNGNPNTGGTWLPVLNSGNSFFDPTVDAPGIYTYTTGDVLCGIDSATVTVSIEDLPNPGIGSEVTICKDDSPFNLLDLILDNPEPNGIWSPSLASGTDIFNPQLDGAGTYSYTVNNSICGSNSTDMIITIVDKPNAGIDNSIQICETSSPIYLFSALNGSPDQGGTWQPALASNLGFFDPQLDAAGVYTYSVNNGYCETVTAQIEISVTEQPNPGISTAISICYNNLPFNLTTELGSTAAIGGSWSPSLSSNSSIFNPSLDTQGIYTYTIGNDLCGYQYSTVEVTFTYDEPITNFSIETNGFSDNNSITITVNSDLQYEYSLDNITYQNSNIFNNLSGGIYTIYAREIDGCGVLEEDVSVIGYPKFFTPNDDGTNDYWGLLGVNNNTYKVFIYNRYGKVLSVLNNNNPHWNGIYNGNNLPTSDYWFTITLDNGISKSGHFTLKR